MKKNPIQRPNPRYNEDISPVPPSVAPRYIDGSRMTFLGRVYCRRLRNKLPVIEILHYNKTEDLIVLNYKETNKSRG